jgi:hypothetical protein
MRPDLAYLGTGHVIPTLTIGLVKTDNGYTVQLQESPKPPPRVKTVSVEASQEEADPDELIDRMVDGMGALMRAIHNDAAEEDWKKDDDKAKVRAAFKAIFPNIVSQVQRQQNYVPPEEPRYENLVFEKKEDLLKYLEKNL